MTGPTTSSSLSRLTTRCTGWPERTRSLSATSYVSSMFGYLAGEKEVSDARVSRREVLRREERREGDKDKGAGTQTGVMGGGRQERHRGGHGQGAGRTSVKRAEV